MGLGGFGSRFDPLGEESSTQSTMLKPQPHPHAHLHTQLTPPKPATATATTDISSGGDNDDDGEEIVITTRQLAEINGVLVFEGEDEDRDALSCPLIRRYHEGTLRVLVREAPFLARPRARAGEFDVAVRMVEGSGEEDESEEEVCVPDVCRCLIGWLVGWLVGR